MSDLLKYKVFINGRLGIRQTNPLGINTLKEQYSKETGGKLSYARRLIGKLTFTGADFTYLYRIEKSIYRCEQVNVSVQKKCDNIFTNWFTGYISLNDAAWDLDQCKVTAEVNVIDRYSCITDNGDKEVNLFELISERKTITTIPGTIEYAECDYLDPGCLTDPFFVEYRATYEEGRLGTIGRRYYARYNYGGGSYGYPLLYAPYDYVYGDGSGEFGFKIVGGDGSTASIDNGMTLKNVLEKLLQNICPGLTVKSDFFQINPDNVLVNNYVTGQPSKVANLIIFQKSDIKRPNVSGNATRAIITIDKLLKNLTNLFNIGWFIDDDNRLVIEHISYLSSVSGLNLTSLRYANNVRHKKKYTYDKDKMPKRETFRYVEADGIDFVGLPIIYNSRCVNNDEKEYEASLFNNDVQMVLDNPASNSEKVKDSGFVLVACNGADAIITEPAVISGEPRLNNSLGYAQLHRDYWRHGRVLLTGNMNGTDQTFLSAIKTKKQEKLTIPFCCGDSFNPNHTILTALGIGEVDKAEFNLWGETLELDLLFGSDIGLTTNVAPVANPDMAVTPMDTPIVIDVLANDTDADGSIVPSSITIYTTAHCSVVVDSLFRLIVTPAIGFTGTAYVYYKIRDEWNQESNFGIVSIMVYDGLAAPIAVDDNYNTEQNTSLTISAAAGVLANDIDDQGIINLTVTPYSGATSAGGSVVLNADGSFYYTPPSPSYTGTDTFPYNVTDSTGLNDTGLVSILVRDPNSPLAVNDNYRTVIDVVLSVPSATGLTINDLDNGPLLATAETVATVQGGSVTISANGAFVYTPPTGYTGPDSFDYTITDSDLNTDVGTAFIDVLPLVYVRLLTYNIDNTLIIEDCGSGGSRNRGRERTADFKLEYFADSGATIPMDITGLAIQIDFRMAFVDNLLSITYNSDLSTPGEGIDDIIGTDEIISRTYSDCSDTTTEDYDIYWSVLPNPDYIII